MLREKPGDVPMETANGDDYLSAKVTKKDERN